ncbi:MAG: hypothetical protein ABI083_20580 [Lapillicoccus sp.]
MSQPSVLRPARAASTAPRPVGRRAAMAPLRVVPSAIGRSGNGLFAGVCAVVLLTGLVALLMLNTSLAQGAFELTSLQQKSGVLADTQEQVTASLDAQRSPRSLAAQAQQMGMVPAESMAFIRLSDGKIIGEAKPALDSQRLTIITSPVAPPPAPPAPPAAAAPVQPPAPAGAAPPAPAVAAPPAPAVAAPPAAPAAPAAAKPPAAPTPGQTTPSATR